MKKAIIIILLLIAFTKVDGQLLLTPDIVANPSFEYFTQCPDNQSQISRAYPWSDCLGGNGSSDYYNTCTNLIWMLQFLNMQHPRTGDGEAAFYMYGTGLNHDYREYIMGTLTDSLKHNKRYCGEFYTSLINNSMTAVENMGMYFSVDTVLGFHNGHGLYTLQPQIENHNGIITDTINWVRVYGTFISSGREKYLTIGNFTDNIHTNFQNLSGAAIPAYYYIDDVSVCECSFQFNLGNDTTLCTGNSLLLNPNIPNAIYTWQDSGHAPTFTVAQAGVYWVRAYFPDYNITTSDTINISYVSAPVVNLGNDTTLCKGQSLLLNAAYPNCIYQWQDGTTQPTYNITQQGIYWVNLTNNFNCTALDSIRISYIGVPFLKAISDTSLCEGIPFIISIPNGTYSILWNDGDTNYLRFLNQSGIYNITLTNQCGIISDSFKLDFIDCNVEPIIPNIITPNGDGYNDFFYIKNTEYWNIDVQIFNRWGTIVYQNNTYKNTWDGKDLADGVYYYIIKATNNNGYKKEYKGSVTVLR